MRIRTATRSTRAVRLAGALGLSAILTTGLGCNRGTVAGQLSDDSDNTVTMELREDYVKSEGSIYATFAMAEGDLSAGLAKFLELGKDGRPLYRLYWQEDGGPTVVPYRKFEDAKAEDSDAISVGGPYRFDLPPLEPGAYRVCNAYSIVRPGAEEAEHGTVCADLTVEP